MTKVGRKQERKYWYVLAVLCGLAASSVGLCINSVGVFYAPVADDLGILRGSFAMHATIASTVTAVTALFAPKWMSGKRFRLMLTGGVLLAGISTCLMGSVSTIPMFYLLGCLRGIGNAAYGMVILTVVLNQWFRARHGLATSIVLSFGGIAGALCSPLLTAVIERQGWRVGYMVMGILIIGFCVPAMIYPFTLTPQEKGMLPYGAEIKGEEVTEETEKRVCTSFSESSFIFICMLIVGILHTAITCLPQHFPGFADNIGYTAAVGAAMLSFCMFGNIISKLLIGVIADYMTPMKATNIMIGIHLASIFLLLTARQETSLYLAAFLFGFVYSVSAVGLVLITKESFGIENYNKVYPLISFAGGISCAVGMSMVGYLYDFTGTYQSAFLAAAVFHVVDLVLLFAIRKKSFDHFQ